MFEKAVLFYWVTFFVHTVVKSAVFAELELSDPLQYSLFKKKPLRHENIDKNECKILLSRGENLLFIKINFTQA